MSNGLSTRRTSSRSITIAAIIGLIASLLVPLATASPVGADGGDYTITFRAAAPFTYDHSTGGGAWNDGTVGKNDDIVPQLEGGDFQCGDIVTYLTKIVRDNDLGGHPAETIQLDLSFLADTTGQSGAAMSEIVSVGINYGAVQNGDPNPPGTDSGIVDDGGSTATLLSQTLTGPLFTMGSELLASIEIDDLEINETVILRTDVRLACQPFSNPTGNLQGQLDQATVVIAPNGDVITSAAQTIPFKQIGDLPVATITIVKDAVPASSDVFSFTVDPPIFDVVDNETISSFDLVDDTDDPDPTESQSFAISPNPSLMYTVTEEDADGWVLTDITCEGATASSVSSPSVDITVVDKDNVTCTFTNTLAGNIIVEKQTDPDGSPQSFDFTTNYGDPFSLSDGQNNDSGPLLPTSEADTYSVAETVPAGWTLSSATCDDGSEPTAIDLAAGETVTCTFNNTIDRGNIVVVKQTDPDGSLAVFDFTTNYGDPFSLSDGQNNDSGPLLPTSEADTYSVAETVPAGWDLTSATCDDGSEPTAIDLAAGETVTCTFTNTLQRGNIVVVKQTDPDGSPQSFDFTSDYGDPFSLTDGQNNDSGPLLPGTYSVSETVPAGWDLASATCNDGSAPGAIDLNPGETVTCTFNNQQDANIVVVKQTDPDGSLAVFDFTTNYGAPFSLSDGQPNDSGDLDPGTYSVEETGAPAGWSLSGATCSDGSEPSAIDLQAGETVTCTFNNTIGRGTIVVLKQTDPDGSLAVFDFTTNYGDPFSLTDGQNKITGDLLPSSEVGPYSVAETNIPSGWSLTSATCDNGSDPSSISLDPGQTVTCTFNNTLARGTIIVEKQTDPDGSPQVFDFTTNYGAGFSLADGDTSDSGPLLPSSEAGPYSVSETVPDGWDLTDVTCDDGSAPGAIDLGPNETVTCVFTNQQDANIVIVKQTLPDGNNTTFDFTATYDAAGFTLGDGQNNDSGDLDPGSYTVSETVPAGWDLTDLTCADPTADTDDSGDEAIIELSAGETVTCTFTNTQRGTIAVAKETVPDGDPATFGFTGDVVTTLGDGQTSTPVEVIPGQHSATETVPAGWDLTDISCDDGNSTGTNATATFNVEPGENVVCTFTNTKRGMVELLKLTNGAENQTMGWNFTLTGPEVDESDSSPPTTVDFGGAKLIPGEEYTLCEVGIPAGWTLEWSVDTTGDGIADTIIPVVSGVNDDPVDPATGFSRVYDPNYVAPPGQYTNDTRCVNFVVDPGQTLDFQIDNQFPGGEPRTIGFWKNWNTCTDGNQPTTAAENGGPDQGWFILDDLLNDPGYTIGVLQLDGADCEDAVNILDKRSIDDDKKRASDGAYNLASQLLAAQVNLSAGAETCQEVVDAVNAAQALLAGIGFDGTGSYLQGGAASEANALAATLDAYNNGELCGGGEPPPPPVLTPGGIGGPEGASGSTTVFEIPITLSAPSTETITVDYIAWPCTRFGCSDGLATAPDDYELVTPGTVTFMPGETVKTVPVTVVGDDDAEPKVLWGEWFFVRFQNPSGAVLDTSFFGLGAGIIGEDDS